MALLNEAINYAAFPLAKALVPDEYEEGLFQYDPAYQHTPLDFARERLTLLESALYGFWGSPLTRNFFGDLVQGQGDFQNQELWLAVAHGELLRGYFITFGDTAVQADMRTIIKEKTPWPEGNGRNGGPTGTRFEPEINHIKIIDCAIPEHSIATLARARIPLIDMVDTENISSLGFPNPFCSMFKGKADEKLFENSKACIKSHAFWGAWEGKRHAKEIRALPQKQPLKEDTPKEDEKKESKFGNEELAALITAGENNTVEFKESARWDMRQNKQSKVMEDMIVESGAAFLNAEGGTLLIGVKDDGSISGLKHDYKTLGKKQNRDGFENWLMGLLLDRYKKDITPHIAVSFHDCGGEDVCRLKFKKAHRPVLMQDGKLEWFLVRTGNSKRRFSISEAIQYCKQHWSG